MKKYPFLRRPAKLILYSLLFTLITTAALIFAWQYVLDGIALDYSLRNYAYIGTVYDESASEPLLKELPGEIADPLRQSEYVDLVQHQQILGAKLEDASAIPEHMMTTNQLNQHYFVEAVILSNQSPPQDDPIRYEIYSARLQKQWGADTIRLASITIVLTRLEDEPGFEEGQHIFLIGNYMMEYNAVKTNLMQVYSPGASETLGLAEKSALYRNPYTVLPEGLTPLEAEEQILAWMDQTEIHPLYDRYKTLGNNVTLRVIQDMSMLPYMANGRVYIADGRQLYETDQGKPVCVISQGLSLRNRLSIGDTIRISLADGSYTASDAHTIAGYESGFPMEDSQESLVYAEAVEFEIVGIFNQLSKVRTDPFFYTQNDIFIPVGVASVDNNSALRPYTFTFRVLGPDMDAFLAEFQDRVEEEGYAFSIIDAGWEDVSDSFYAMQDRRGMMLVCAIAAFAVAITLLVVLLQQNFRYEYGVMRLLGAYQKEAIGTYIAGFGFCAIPGVLLSVAVGWSVYVLWLKDAISGIVPVMMPGDLECILTLLGWSAGEAAIAFSLLLTCVFLSERNRLLKLIH